MHGSDAARLKMLLTDGAADEIAAQFKAAPHALRPVSAAAAVLSGIGALLEERDRLVPDESGGGTQL